MSDPSHALVRIVSGVAIIVAGSRSAIIARPAVIAVVFVVVTALLSSDRATNDAERRSHEGCGGTSTATVIIVMVMMAG